jgi:hypothetical protein
MSINIADVSSFLTCHFFGTGKFFSWELFLVTGRPYTLGKQDSKLGHENGPTNNFLSLVWNNITKLPHRIELDIPKNRMFFLFRYCYILAGK